MTRIATLSEMGIVKTGKTPSKNNPEFWGDKVGFITPSDFTSSKYVYASRRISQAGVNALRNAIVPRRSVLVTCIGSDMGKVARVEEESVITNQQINTLIVNTSIADADFIYYSLKAKYELLRNLGVGSGSTMPIINKTTFEKIKIELPNLETQKKIANILSSLDEKIELNRRMNETLEQLGQALFRHYFVDNPEAKSWESGTLGDIVVNFDSRRKPLSSRQRAKMQGDYRYFGATSVMDHVNDYLFDGTYLLLAEDGSVMRSDGTPYLQYVWGRFWVNNHAHIIQAKYPFTVEYLYLLLAKTNVQSLASGAVQLKINQRAMNSLVISIPPDDLVIKFCNLVNSLFAQYRENEGQIELLVNLRDSLLPKLISGEVEI